MVLQRHAKGAAQQLTRQCTFKVIFAPTRGLQAKIVLLWGMEILSTSLPSLYTEFLYSKAR